MATTKRLDTNAGKQVKFKQLNHKQLSSVLLAVLQEFKWYPTNCSYADLVRDLEKAILCASTSEK